MTNSTFVWHDLFSTDPDAARDFYSQLLGWTVSEQDMGDAGTHATVMARNTAIGGISALTPDHGSHSNWVSHTSVDDLTATMETIRTTGGTISGEPWSMTGVGTGVFAKDPEGAVFAPFQDANVTDEAPVSSGNPAAGTAVWHELGTSDVARAVAFYTSIFGWNHVVWPMGEFDYHGMTIGETPVAGIFEESDASRPSAWTIYFEVPGSIDEAIASVPMLGGTLVGEKIAVPGTGEFQLAQDPGGAAFGLLKSEAM